LPAKERGLVVRKDASLSDDGLYRYDLTRTWGDGGRLVFVMLNPSTADASVDDPTIRRCMGFAQREEYDGIHVVNLYALRATDPDELRRHPDPYGPDNHAAVWGAVTSHLTVGVCVAWGAHPMAVDHPMIDTLRELSDYTGIELQCLGKTKAGAPKHPLYIKADKDLEAW
jgi:hypothetical protein